VRVSTIRTIYTNDHARHEDLMPRQHLSELEGAVLGLLWSKGPTTPYAVRTEFLRSLNPHWSGSAGAIYPLVRRLERRRWIRAATAVLDGRRTRPYRLTAGGLRIFRRWLGPPLLPRVAGVPPDPLRTRVEFLGALSRRQQVRFLAAAEREVRRHLERVQTECRSHPRHPRSWQSWTAVGARDMLHGRLAWLQMLGRAVRQGAR
jgi:DNA-binding PadR family transcriptional regulator